VIDFYSEDDRSNPKLASEMRHANFCLEEKGARRAFFESLAEAGMEENHD
jgi:hypothetical protein